MAAEPRMGGFVMNVHPIEERAQDVHIQKCDHRVAA